MQQEMFDLIIKCLKNEASEQEMTSVYRWIHQSGINKAKYEEIRDALISESLNEEVDKIARNKSWNRINMRIDFKKQPSAETRFASLKRDPLSFTLTWQKLAAAVIFAFLLGGFGALALQLYNHKQLSQQYYSIEAPLGAQSRITMADGSEIFLNAGSNIRYPKNFNEKNRDIYLEGEGYFKIAKHKHLQFRVFASEIIVQALGTEFNVKAYPDEDRIETTLVEGSVSIKRNKPGESGQQQIILEPNQKVSFLEADETFVSDNMVGEDELQINAEQRVEKSKPLRMTIEKNVNTVLYTSWVEKKWVLERENLESLVQKMERQFDVHMIIEDDELKQFNISGTLLDESLTQVLEALKLTIPLNYKINEKEVRLSLDEHKVEKYEYLLKNHNRTLQ